MSGGHRGPGGLPGSSACRALRRGHATLTAHQCYFTWMPRAPPGPWPTSWGPSWGSCHPQPCPCCQVAGLRTFQGSDSLQPLLQPGHGVCVEITNSTMGGAVRLGAWGRCVPPAHQTAWTIPCCKAALPPGQGWCVWGKEMSLPRGPQSLTHQCLLAATGPWSLPWPPAGGWALGWVLGGSFPTELAASM